MAKATSSCLVLFLLVASLMMIDVHSQIDMVQDIQGFPEKDNRVLCNNPRLCGVSLRCETGCHCEAINGIWTCVRTGSVGLA